MKEPERKYNLGDMVYLLTDPEQLERMVVGYTVRPDSVKYHLACAMDESNHYEMEMTLVVDMSKKLGVNK